jgi:hypothetical protein
MEAVQGVCFNSELPVSGNGWNGTDYFTRSIPASPTDSQLRSKTSNICHIYTFHFLMMGCLYARNIQRCENSINRRKTVHRFIIIIIIIQFPGSPYKHAHNLLLLLFHFQARPINTLITY